MLKKMSDEDGGNKVEKIYENFKASKKGENEERKFTVYDALNDGCKDMLNLKFYTFHFQNYQLN